MSNPDQIKNTGLPTSKANPFRVPEGYFNRLPVILHSQKNLSESRNLKSQSWSIRYYAAAALIIVAAIISAIAVFNNQKTDDTDMNQEISMMVEQNIYSIQEEVIWEAIKVAENNESKDESIEYLINEDINENEILNAL